MNFYSDQNKNQALFQLKDIKGTYRINVLEHWQLTELLLWDDSIERKNETI